MRVMIGYASSEGQTRRIARRLADHIADAGNMVELLAVEDADDIALDRFDRVILAGSIHVGHYQRQLSDFAASQADQLNGKPTLLISVSLAAAGHDAEDWKALDRIVADFEAATGWSPGQVAQVAGAYRPSSYDIFRKFVMRRILAAKEPDADPNLDKEYTDWAALNQVIDTWLEASAD